MNDCIRSGGESQWLGFQNQVRLVQDTSIQTTIVQMCLDNPYNPHVL